MCILSSSPAGHARDCNPGPELTSHPATHVKQTQGYTTLTKTLKNNKHQVETYLKFFTYTRITWFRYQNMHDKVCKYEIYDRKLAPKNVRAA